MSKQTDIPAWDSHRRVQKVVFWGSPDEKHLYIFLGRDHGLGDKLVKKIEAGRINSLRSSDQQMLAQLLGDTWQQSLAFNADDFDSVTIVPESIFDDDTVLVARWKLFDMIKHLKQSVPHPDYLYMWYEARDTIDVDTFLRKVIPLSQETASFEYFKDMFQVCFEKKKAKLKAPGDVITYTEALELMRTSKIEQLSMPLEHDYTNLQLQPVAIAANPFKDVRIDSMFTNDQGEERRTFQYISLSQKRIGIREWIHVTNVKAFWDALQVVYPEESTKRKFYGAVKKYFPQLDAPKALKRLEPVAEDKDRDGYLKTIQNTDTLVSVVTHSQGYQDTVTDAQCIVHKLHMHLENRKMSSPLDIPLLFEHLQLAPDAPFFTFHDLNNNYYRVRKDSVGYKKAQSVIMISDEFLKKWTSTGKDKNQQLPRISRKQRSLRVKLFFKTIDNIDMFFTLVIYDDGVVDIKYSFSSQQMVTLEDIKQSLPSANAFLEAVENVLVMPNMFYRFDEAMLYNQKAEFIECEVFLDYFFKHNTNMKSAMNWLDTMYPYVDIVSKDGLKKASPLFIAKYKRVDNYAPMDAIEDYMNQHYQMSKEELIGAIQQVFTLTEAQARHAYDEKSEKLQLDIMRNGGDLAYKPKLNGGVNIQVQWINHVHVRCQLKGLKSLDVASRVFKLILLSWIHENRNELQVDAYKLGSKDKKRIQTFVDQAVTNDVVAPVVDKVEEEDVFNLNDNWLEKLGDGGEDEDDDAAGLLSAFAEVDDVDMDADVPGAVVIATNDDDTNGNDAGVAQSRDAPQQDDDTEEGTEAAIDLDNLDDPKKRKQYEKLILTRLIAADKALFKYNVEGQYKLYSTQCQSVVKRQPVILSEQEKKYIDEHYPGSYFDFYVKTGSDDVKRKQNFFVCPQVWCPLSKVTLTTEQLKRLDNRCPAPIREPPILLQSDHWEKAKKGNNIHYPGFLKANKHPQRLLMPCCFKQRKKEAIKNGEEAPSMMENTKVDTEMTVANDGAQADDDVNKDRYILKLVNTAIDPARLGVLPDELAAYLSSQKCSGLLKEGSTCYVRRGVVQDDTSFLTAVASVLDIAHAKTGRDVVGIIEKNLKPTDFVRLNHGNTVKMFFNEDESPYELENFKRFKKWFMKQSEYHDTFFLHDLANALHGIKSLEKGESKWSTSMFHGVLREYMIYNAFTNFMYYLRSDIPKHHEELYDLVSPRFTWLNEHAYNIMVFEQLPDTNRVVMHCPSYKSTIDFTRPFVMILKQGKSYEPIVQAILEGGTIRQKHTFRYSNDGEWVRRLADHMQRGCRYGRKDEAVKKAIDVYVYLASKGYAVKATVLNMSLKVCGFLLSGDVYIPLEMPAPWLELRMTDAVGMRYTYIHDVIGMQPSWKISKIRGLLHKLGQHLESSFYLEHKEVKGAGLLLGTTSSVDSEVTNTYAYIPLNAEESGKLIHLAYHDEVLGLDGLVPNKWHGDSIEYIQHYQSVVGDLVRDMLTNGDTADRLKYIRHPLNPMPVFSKKELIRTMIGDWIKDKAAQLSGFIKRHLDNIVTDLYAKEPRYILQTSLKVAIKKDSVHRKTNDIRLDQYDIYQNKIDIMLQERYNPYQFVKRTIDDYVDYTPLDSVIVDPKQKARAALDFKFETFEDIAPAMRWQKVLHGYVVHAIEESDLEYSNDYLLKLFAYAAKMTKSKVTYGVLQTMLESSMKTAFKDRMSKVRLLKELYNQNGSFHKLVSNRSEESVYDLDWDTFWELVSSSHYYYSTVELRHMANFLKINVICIGRQNNTKLPNGMRCFYTGSKTFMIFHTTFDKNKEVYRIVLRRVDKHFLLDSTDTSSAFRDMLNKYCRTIEIEAEEEEE
jgi:hypothetical protein